MKDHYSLKKQWQLTVESWDKSNTKSKKVKKSYESSCANRKGKKKVKEEEAAGAVEGAVTAGSPDVTDDGGYDSDDQKQIARYSAKVGKRKTPQTRMGEEIHKTLNRTFNKALTSESIVFQEEGDEDMGAEDEIEDVDEPEMEMGGEDLPIGDEMEDEPLLPEPEGEEIPEAGADSDVQARLDKIESMLQQLLDIEGGEETEELSDIEGEDAADIMGDMGMEDPELEPSLPVDEPVIGGEEEIEPEDEEIV